MIIAAGVFMPGGRDRDRSRSSVRGVGAGLRPGSGAGGERGDGARGRVTQGIVLQRGLLLRPARPSPLARV